MAMSTRGAAREGFSLMEILIAITILGVIMAMVGPALYNALAGAKKNTTKATLKILKTQIGLYQMHTNQLPQTLKDLIKKPQDERVSKKWEGPYLEPAETPEDGWGNTFSYKLTPGGKHSYELFSYGPNGKGSPKDEQIGVWDDEKKRNKGAFTLLEILIVIAIIGVLGAIIMPNLQRTTPRYEREEFIARFNALMQLGWQQALVHNKAQRISVDIEKRSIFLSSATGEKDRSGESVFKIPIGLNQDTSLVLPDQIVIKQFFVEGFDMMGKFTGRKTAEMWFYIVPEGMAQDVIVNFLDTKDTKNDAPRHVGLVLNPFTAQFKIYDAFQKP